MRGMVFGVFDGLHEGHKRFLTDARSRCDELVIVVARDISTEKRKGNVPRAPEAERARLVSDFMPDAKVVLGDAEEGNWHVINEHDPERVFVGYDQGELSRAFKKLGIPFTFLNAHEPDKYKSSLI